MDCGVMDCVSVYGWLRIKVAIARGGGGAGESNGPCVAEIKHGESWEMMNTIKVQSILFVLFLFFLA